MNQADRVVAVEEALELPTYPLGEAEIYPLFFEKRVYQGSSGKVYPVPFIDKVYDEPEPVTYRSIRLENEYVRLVLLPEIGGRIFIAQDKSNADYDFFYRQEVIKPALVGLAGPWISGGVEFNWPQHHRPGTYLPADWHIEEETDGACTVWMSEHDPIHRLKGMHGIRLRPGSARVELRARLYNRTPLTQTFLWWANVAARVHDQYQSFFPEDVHYVADHAVRAMSSFPVAENDYYGVDYAARPGANDLSWYKNIPVPTSYMICETEFDFFGGYDHAAQGGFVHVADRRIAPGKKQWTWGNHAFGHAWDRELTDPTETGEYPPYVELMAGVYTDNQPDFTYLRPGEVKTFTQTWWPYSQLGPVQQANERVALRLKVTETGGIDAGVAVSEKMEGLRIRLSAGGEILSEAATVALEPGRVWRPEPAELKESTTEALHLAVYSAEGRCLLEHRPVEPRTERGRELATEPPAPEAMERVDELYLTGEHLELYRHPTRYPEKYWEEALRLDPDHAKSRLALGRQALQRGSFAVAERHLRAAAEKLTARHPNPETGEAHYYLGLALRYLGREAEAGESFAKAAWDGAWTGPAQLELAALALRQGDTEEALQAVEVARDVNRRCNRARLMAAIALRRKGCAGKAREELESLLLEDPLDFWARWELAGDETEREAFFRDCRNDAQTILDLVFDYADCGEYAVAARLLAAHEAQESVAVAVPNPMERNLATHYVGAWLEGCQGNFDTALQQLEAAATLVPDYFFPSRLQEQLVLEWALKTRPDGNAAFALGNYCYDRKRHDEAIGYWEQAVKLKPEYAVAWRNLGIGRWNRRDDPDGAREAYLRALDLAPEDARLVAEYAQLMAKCGRPAGDRLTFLESREDLVRQRDDACVEWAALLNETGQAARALELLEQRRFHPWEGGEGKVLRQYTRARLLLGEATLEAGDPEAALEHFEKAIDTPPNLGEAYHLLQAKADVNYWRGRALRALGREEAAREAFRAAAEEAGDFQQMAVTEHSELSYYRALALAALGEVDAARRLLEEVRQFAENKRATPAKIDYFATSLPDLLVFEDDLEASKNAEAERLLHCVEEGLRQIGVDS